MINSIDEYLQLLEDEMKDADTADRHDALNDAEEHLRSALYEAKEAKPDIAESELLQDIINNFGHPRDTAAEYSRTFGDRSRAPVSGKANEYSDDSYSRRFFRVFSDGRTWRAFLYCIISLPFGIFYFTWCVTGISVAASLMVLIIGLPVGAAFFFSFHGLAFLEGRIIESLLGVKMPPRRRFLEKDISWLERIKRLLLGRDSWKIIAYQLLMLPLGIVYFTIAVTLTSVSIGLITAPIVQLILNFPLMSMHITGWVFAPWMLPFAALTGFLLLKASLHIIRGIGIMHGGIAESFLITVQAD